MPKTDPITDPVAERAEQVPGNLRISCEQAEPIRLLEAADGDAQSDGNALRRFEMVAYTGGPMRLAGWQWPVVVDLQGLRVSRKARPILKDHDRSRIVGHTTDIAVRDDRLHVEGVISGVGQAAEEVVATSRNGFPWQASIGAEVGRVIVVAEGKQAKANGRTIDGPAYVVRQSTLSEVSFVALGADDATSARVAAGQQSAPEDLESHREEDAAASTNHSLACQINDSLDLGQAEGGLAETASRGPHESLQRMRQEMAREARRVAGIRRLCGGREDDLEATAIEKGWDVERTELELLRRQRPVPPRTSSGNSRSHTQQTLEAAACLSVGLPEDRLLAQYGERTLESAHPLRNIGLRELVAECARLEGLDVPRVFGDGTATIRAGFSTVSLPGILENVMNKVLLDSYQSTPIAALDLCSVGRVTDFKEVSRYRLLGTGGFEQVAPDGELKHGKLSEQKYTNKAETYGQILMLTRQDIINDDLSAFMDIPRQMGRSGAELIDHLFFGLLLANPGSFFGAGNSNLLSGATTAFGSDSLTQAKTLFRKQKAGPGSDPKDQRPINIRPEFLLVPVELETEAELLMGAAQLMLDGSNSKTKIPVDNPHRNKYRVLSAPHLSDTYYAGASAKAWYLFANPSVLAAFEIVFLNGRRMPTIERIESQPNMLGMGFRAYLDVGIKEQDPRAAVKVTGE